MHQLPLGRVGASLLFVVAGCSSEASNGAGSTIPVGGAANVAGQSGSAGVAAGVLGGASGTTRGGSTQSGGTLGGSGGKTTAGVGGNGGSGGLDSGMSSCNATKVTCKIAVPDCSLGSSLVAPNSFGFVPEVDASGTCYTGRCVAIESCACATASDCPDSNLYTCWTSARHCGPYVD